MASKGKMIDKRKDAKHDECSNIFIMGLKLDRGNYDHEHVYFYNLNHNKNM